MAVATPGWVMSYHIAMLAPRTSEEIVGPEDEGSTVIVSPTDVTDGGFVPEGVVLVLPHAARPSTSTIRNGSARIGFNQFTMRILFSGETFPSARAMIAERLPSDDFDVWRDR